MQEALRARSALRDAVQAYAVARTPEQVRACLPALEQIAGDPRYPRLAAEARFAIAHAFAYALDEPDRAVELFQQVIEQLPTESLAVLAVEQIEALRQRRQGAAP